MLRWRGLDEVMAEELTVLPGMDEVGSLLWIADHHDSGQYDVVVVDWNGRPYTIDRRPIALCRCGESSRKPFCDGTHRSCGFVGDQAAGPARPDDH